MSGHAASGTQSVYPRMRDTGRAIMLTRGNNTHSGNLALRDPDDPDGFFITASGSQIGALVPSDVVPVRFTRVSWGDGRASTESTVHRKILSIPGVQAAIHAHYLSATSVSFGGGGRDFMVSRRPAMLTSSFTTGSIQSE